MVAYHVRYTTSKPGIPNELRDKKRREIAHTCYLPIKSPFERRIVLILLNTLNRISDAIEIPHYFARKNNEKQKKCYGDS